MLLLAASGLACTLALAFDLPDVDYPAITARAKSPEGFVPAGWQLEHLARGRLDEDELDDALLVLRMGSPANIVDNDGFGPDRFDTNPRMLVAVVAEPDGDWRRVMADSTLVPRPESPVMDDFFDGDASSAVTIRANRSWAVSLRSWASAGSWSTRTVTYTLRLEDRCMRLIGYDDRQLHRGSGDMLTTSVNYLSGRAWTQAGRSDSDIPGPQRWTRPTSTAPICIGDIGDGFRFAPELEEQAHVAPSSRTDLPHASTAGRR